MARLTASTTTAWLTAGVLTAGLLSAAPPATAAVGPSAPTVAPRILASPAVPDGLRLVRTNRSLLGTHTWYQQTVDGVPVVGGWYAVHQTAGGRAVADGRVAVDLLRLPAAARRVVVPARAAVTAVTRRAGAPAYGLATSRGLAVLPADGERPARVVYAVLTVNGRGATLHYVDAGSARVLLRETISQEAAPRRTGRGRVFTPNPVVRLQDQSLRDRKDSASALPRRTYRMVPLDHLHQHTLIGRWVEIINKNRPVRRDHRFRYDRSDDRFEMVNAYYAVERAQEFLQRLGFRGANAQRQRVKTNAFPVDNSFYEPETDRILFGAGGVDDAEDLEVVWHEYGHAIQDAQVPGFGSRAESGAIGEGFGDYLAVTMSQPDSADTRRTPLACVADWDATSYTPGKPHCLRRVDGSKVYPTDIVDEVHDDGEIWSRALWDINQGLGRRRATTLIIEAQFSFTPTIGFVPAAETTVATAQALYGDVAAGVVQQAFADRGILPPPT